MVNKRGLMWWIGRMAALCFVLICVCPVLGIIYGEITMREVCYELCPFKDATTKKMIREVNAASRIGCESGIFGICEAKKEEASRWFPKLSSYDETEDCVVWCNGPIFGLTLWKDNLITSCVPVNELALFADADPESQGADSRQYIYYASIKRNIIKDRERLWNAPPHPGPIKGKTFELIPCTTSRWQ